MSEIRFDGKENSELASQKTQSKNAFMYFVAAIAALGGILFGFDTGVIAGALIFIKQTFLPPTYQQELVVSMVVLGAFFGCLLSGSLANRYGRKKVLLFTSFIFIAGTAICSLAPDVITLIAGRFVLGLGVGIASYAAPLFIAEISVPDKRGAMVLLNSMFITGAQAAAFLIDFFFAKHLGPTISWRFMIGIAIVPSVLLMVGMIIAPHSPRWLMMKGKREKARGVLTKIRDLDTVEAEIDEIEKSLKEKHGGIRTLFSKRLRPVLVIGLVLGIGQQFVGINTVMYYGPEIFEHVGFHGSMAQILATFGMGLLNFVFTVFCIFTVDRFGRRALLLSGTFLAAVCLFILGLVLHIGPASIPGGQIIAVSSLVLYLVGYCISVGSLFWLIISEIYPLEIRSVGMSFVAGIQWLANFFVTATFLTALQVLGSGVTFWVYGLACLGIFLFVLFYVPETKGVSLETIELNLDRGVKPRDLGRTDAAS